LQYLQFVKQKIIFTVLFVKFYVSLTASTIFFYFYPFHVNPSVGSWLQHRIKMFL